MRCIKAIGHNRRQVEPEREIDMTNLFVTPDYWQTRVLPEGTLERWLVPDGTVLKKDDPVAELRIEGELVILKAPVAGRLFVDTKPNSIIEPGSVIGHLRDAG